MNIDVILSTAPPQGGDTVLQGEQARGKDNGLFAGILENALSAKLVQPLSSGETGDGVGRKEGECNEQSNNEDLLNGLGNGDPTPFSWSPACFDFPDHLQEQVCFEETGQTTPEALQEILKEMQPGEVVEAQPQQTSWLPLDAGAEELAGPLQGAPARVSENNFNPVETPAPIEALVEGSLATESIPNLNLQVSGEQFQSAEELAGPLQGVPVRVSENNFNPVETPAPIEALVKGSLATESIPNPNLQVSGEQFQSAEELADPLQGAPARVSGNNFNPIETPIPIEALVEGSLATESIPNLNLQVSGEQFQSAEELAGPLQGAFVRVSGNNFNPIETPAPIEALVEGSLATESIPNPNLQVSGEQFQLTEEPVLQPQQTSWLPLDAGAEELADPLQGAPVRVSGNNFNPIETPIPTEASVEGSLATGSIPNLNLQATGEQFQSAEESADPLQGDLARILEDNFKPKETPVEDSLAFKSVPLPDRQSTREILQHEPLLSQEGEGVAVEVSQVSVDQDFLGQQGASQQESASQGAIFSLPGDPGGIAPKNDISFASIYTQPQEVFAQVVEKIHLLTRPGEQELRLKLQPEMLGEVLIKLRRIKGLLSAEIMTQSIAVKGLLDDNLETLRQRFQHLNLPVEEFNIYSGGEGKGGLGSDAHNKSRYFNLPFETGGVQAEEEKNLSGMMANGKVDCLV